MVSINVAQLLQSATGAVRDLDFAERLADPSEDIHLLGPVRGHARLTLTSRGILVHADHRVRAEVACARCLDDVQITVAGSFDEEFLPSADVRTGQPLAIADEDLVAERSFIDAHHEITLDETLRQDILTSVPLRVLCDTACPGLCPECGRRRDGGHGSHAEATEPQPAAEVAGPFAKLAALLADDRPPPAPRQP